MTSRARAADERTDRRTDDVRLLGVVLAAACVACAVDLAVRPARGRPPVVFEVHRVDVNRARAAELRCLPGVGAVLAGRIVAERARGPFLDAADLRRVHGIGPTLARRVAPLTAFTPPDEVSLKPP